MRNPKRTSATAAALMIGVALVGFITILASSTKASVADSVDQLVHRRPRGRLRHVRRSVGSSPQLAARHRRAARGRRRHRPPHRRRPRSTAPAPTDHRRRPDGHRSRSSTSASTDGARWTTSAPARSPSSRPTGRPANGWTLGDTVPVRFAETGVQQFTVGRHLHRGRRPSREYFVGLDAFDANVADQFDRRCSSRVADGVDDRGRHARRSTDSGRRSTRKAEVQDRAEFKAAQTASRST